MAISKTEHLLSDRTVTEVTLANEYLKVSLLSQGASIYRLITKDLDGTEADVVLGHKSIEDYIENPFYLGTTVGRYANRIGDASFSINGKKHLLSENDNGNCLHGGKVGFHNKNWDVDIEDERVVFSTESLDGESGFPGHLKVSVTYSLNEETLNIEFHAISDADTHVNLTNHSYFNLGGHESGVIFEHELQMFADEYLEVDQQTLPIAKRSVIKTPFDFKVFKPLVAGLRSTDKQISQASGYDHSFILGAPGEFKKAAIVRHPWSGRILTVQTTEPSVHLYTANHIDDLEGKDGIYYGRYPAFCLETQHFPNSPNKPDFPSTFLQAGKTFNSKTSFTFSLTDED